MNEITERTCALIGDLPAASSEMHRALGRIEGKLDAIYHNQERVLQRQDEIETRVMHLEKRASYQLGIMAVISAIAVIVINFFSKYITFGGGS